MIVMFKISWNKDFLEEYHFWPKQICVLFHLQRSHEKTLKNEIMYAQYGGKDFVAIHVSDGDRKNESLNFITRYSSQF